MYKALNNLIYIDSENLIDEFEMLGQANFFEKHAKYDYLIIDNIGLLLIKNIKCYIQKLNCRILYSTPLHFFKSDFNFIHLTI